MSQKPSVGRVVHYQAYGTPGGEYKSVPRAAIVTEVFTDECVSLCILNPTGMFFATSLMLDEGTTTAPQADGTDPITTYRGGTWHWPPYVPQPKKVA